jgi:hypothetical protein
MYVAHLGSTIFILVTKVFNRVPGGYLVRWLWLRYQYILNKSYWDNMLSTQSSSDIQWCLHDNTQRIIWCASNLLFSLMMWEPCSVALKVPCNELITAEAILPLCAWFSFEGSGWSYSKEVGSLFDVHHAISRMVCDVIISFLLAEGTVIFSSMCGVFIVQFHDFYFAQIWQNS